MLVCTIAHPMRQDLPKIVVPERLKRTVRVVFPCYCVWISGVVTMINGCVAILCPTCQKPRRTLGVIAICWRERLQDSTRVGKCDFGYAPTIRLALIGGGITFGIG